jgi:Zn-dependent peptidase ImmA (M78 family)
VRDGGIEAEANFLAGNLLVPNEAALHIVSQGLMPDAQRLYGVSQAMLEYRLRVSGAHTIHQRRLAYLAPADEILPRDAFVYRRLIAELRRSLT